MTPERELNLKRWKNIQPNEVTDVMDEMFSYIDELRAELSMCSSSHQERTLYVLQLERERDQLKAENEKLEHGRIVAMQSFHDSSDREINLRHQLKVVEERCNCIEVGEDNRKLRERVATLREGYTLINKTECPHFQRMKETCTCVYDVAYIALTQDDEMEKRG